MCSRSWLSGSATPNEPRTSSLTCTATIESTARGYADTFDFWLDQVAVLKPDVLELRYEDVVDDIDAQSRRIAEFLGIPWDPRMVDFHVRAKERRH